MKQLFRWSGALVFLLSLLSMPMLYYRLGVTTDQLSPEMWSRPQLEIRDLIGNAMLFTIFALHHSIMARTGAKRWLTKVVPPDLERSVYVWIASLLFLAVCWIWVWLPGVLWQTGARGVLLCAVQLFGVALTIAAARVVGIWELAGVKQPDLTQPVEFTARGPFGIVRHPIYLGWVLMVFATPTMTAGRLEFAVISTLYLIAAIPLEERSLVEAFGDKYREYQRQMRWRLIPGVW